MTEQIYFPCNEKHKPFYKITFSVDGTEKIYLVCETCATFDYFSKFIIKKEKIGESIWN